MKKLFGAAFVLFALCGQAIAAPAQHVMSLTICTDELLMDLAAPGQIASLSYLSREKAALKLWPEAARLPVNHNTAEEMLAQKPDLVLTLDYASTGLRPLLEKSGIRFLQLPQAENFNQIRAVTRQLGDAIGARARAEALIARMDDTLRQLAASAPARKIRVAGWGGGGFVPGRESLFDAVLEAAGGVNIAQTGGGYYDVESLIAAKPDILAYGDDYIDTPSLRRDQNDHPLLLKLFANRRIVYPAALYGCGVPQSADAAGALRLQLNRAMQMPGGVP
jgi:iron complex transport system substrate-binding protein